MWNITQGTEQTVHSVEFVAGCGLMTIYISKLSEQIDTHFQQKSTEHQVQLVVDCGKPRVYIITST